VSSYWSYAHDKFEDEVFIENAQDWDEVVQRMVDPKMTRFRAMSMDEHATKIEQSAQEALRAKKEIRAGEVIEVQNRGLSMTPKTHARGFLVMEHAQRVIDQLQNDPHLIEMARVPVDNPVECRVGPSGLELIQIE
jgi:hypothetical protein